MKKRNSFLAVILAAFMVALLCFVYSPFSASGMAYASEASETEQCEEILDRGIFVNVSISINGGNNQVWATAKHDFSIFSTTVEIYVYLYYSTFLTTDYTDMTLAASAYTSNLARGSSISATAATDGEQRYWISRMYYKIDNKDWESRVVRPVLYSSTGELIEI